MNATMPLVSVIIPAYNVENEIDRCLRSVFVQTYMNFEIIICDDCSTDGTYEKLKGWESRHSNVKALRQDRKDVYSILYPFLQQGRDRIAKEIVVPYSRSKVAGELSVEKPKESTFAL